MYTYPTFVTLYLYILFVIQITFVGTIEKIEPKINCISHMVRDDSGEIEVLLWIDMVTSVS